MDVETSRSNDGEGCSLGGIRTGVQVMRADETDVIEGRGRTVRIDTEDTVRWTPKAVRNSGLATSNAVSLKGY